MVTIGKTDITTITLTDIKKGLSSGISSVISGTGLCPDGKIMFNNNCIEKKTNCQKFEIPDPATNFTTCKKLNLNDKKQKCIDEGKVLYNNKCLPKVDKKYCLKQGSFLKPDPDTNETSCTEMSSEDVKNNCKSKEVFYQGKCQKILNEKDCSKKLFLELDQSKKNTACKEMSNFDKNEICKKSDKILFNNVCLKKVDDYFCKVNSTWQHQNERIFYAYADKNKNSTECRPPTKEEKIIQCSEKGYNYDETNDKCSCPEGTEIRNGRCLTKKTNQLCFPKETATTTIASFKKPDPNDELGCTDMTDKEKKDYCQNYNTCKCSEKHFCTNVNSKDGTKWCYIDNKSYCKDSIESDYEFRKTDFYSYDACNDKKNNYIYKNNKCMKIFTEEECKLDNSLPNYKNNEFYDTIFYKKPDETKENTICRKLYPEEEKTICLKSENNSLWIDGKCIKKLSKPTLTKVSSSKNQIVLNVKENSINNYLSYTLNYKITDTGTYNNNWETRNISAILIKKDDSSFNFNIDNLKQNTEYKIIVKLIHNIYNSSPNVIETENSDEIIINTLCDGSIYTQNFCRTKIGSFKGPQKSNKYGMINDTEKDPTAINKWPYIKIPNKDSSGNICGCRDFKDNLERAEWCKENIYSDFDFSNGRTVTIENDKCIISPIPVGPINIIQASGLNVNQSIKNDVILQPQNYRTDYPYRIKLYWEYPLDSIRKSGNEDDSIPIKYKIERKEEFDINWQLIHIYDLSTEIDYINLKTFEDSSTNLFYNIFSDNNKFTNCKTECSANTDDSNKLYCNKDENTKIKCLSQSEFYKYYKTQKQLNEGFTSNILSKEFLKKFIKFIWIDGDYGTQSLFKPSEISNFNDASQKLKANTKYLYRITPINQAGEGVVSKVVEAITIPERIKIQQCNSMIKDNPDETISFNGFSKVPDVGHTRCIEMGAVQRNVICSGLIFNRDGKDYSGRYDSVNSKCVPLTSYTLPGAPTIINHSTTKYSVQFTIQPPTEIGSPPFNAYLIKWKNTTNNRGGRLVFNNNFKKNDYTELIAINDLSEQYTVFPSGEWADSSGSITHTSSIKIIHKLDQYGNKLIPDTNYEYTIKCISQSQLWNDSTLSTILDGGTELKGHSDLTSITVKTLKSVPVDNPTLSKIIEPVYNKTFINLSKFPIGKEGSETARIIKYKIDRTAYNMVSGVSDTSTTKSYIIDFSTASSYPILSLIKNSSGSITASGENNQYFYIKNADLEEVGVPTINNNLLFEDRDNVEPSKRYNYRIYSMNNNDFGTSGKRWSVLNNYIDILTPMKDHLSTFNITGSLVISNQLAADHTLNNNPKFCTANFTINNLIDPNIAYYSDYSGLYSSVSNNVSFLISYNHDGIENTASKEVAINGSNNAIVNFQIPLETNFNVKVICQFNGSRTVSGQTSDSIISLASKTFANNKITLNDVKGSTDTNLQFCSRYTDTIENTYEIPYFYNPTTKLCQSRKADKNGYSNVKLNEYCNSQSPGSQWWGNGEVNPCKIPQNGTWTEIPLSSDYTNICRDSNNKINGNSRVCLNANGAAFKTTKKWKYTKESFGGNPVSAPSEATLSNDNFAYKFEQCTNLPNCSVYCSDRYGNLTDNGKTLTGFSQGDMNGNEYCSRGDIQPTIRSNFHNCEECGNSVGPEQGKEWIETSTCIDGYNGSNPNITNCINVLPISSVADTPTNGVFQKNTWYQCKGHGATPNITMDPKFNNILDKNGHNFCDPPFLESTSSRASIDETGNQISQSTTVYRPKYFKITNANCNIKNSGTFSLCNIKETTPPTGWDDNVCGVKTITRPIKCKRNNNQAGIDDLWSCSDPTDVDTSGNPYLYYKKNFNIGNTKEIYQNDTGINCKDKCEGPLNGVTTTSGYDKWTGDNNNVPLDSINYSRKCQVKNTILPLLQKNISCESCTKCSRCSGAPKTLVDKCIDGKYGSDTTIKCTQANRFDIGNIADGTISTSNIKTKTAPFNGLTQIKVKRNIKDNSGNLIDSFDSYLNTSSEYTGNCPQKSCSYKITSSDILATNLNRCRGDKIIDSVRCLDSSGVQVSNIDCGNTNIGDVIVGNNKCTITQDDIKDQENNVVAQIPLDTACNIGEKIYYQNYSCKDSSGNIIDQTYSGDYKNSKTISCFINKDGLDKQVTQNAGVTTVTGKTCTCTCNLNGVPVGKAAIGVNCDTHGANKCESCFANGTVMNNTGECVCDTNNNYTWRTNKCVRDCVPESNWGQWSCSAGTSTRTRGISIYSANGGTQCGNSDLRQESQGNQCEWSVEDWHDAPPNEQYLVTTAGKLEHTKDLDKNKGDHDLSRMIKRKRVYKLTKVPTKGCTCEIKNTIKQNIDAKYAENLNDNEIFKKNIVVDSDGSILSKSSGNSYKIGNTLTLLKYERVDIKDTRFPEYMRGKMCYKTGIRNGYVSINWRNRYKSYWDSTLIRDGFLSKSAYNQCTRASTPANKCFAIASGKNGQFVYYIGGPNSKSVNWGQGLWDPGDLYRGMGNELATNFPDNIKWTDCDGDWTLDSNGNRNERMFYF